MTTYAGLTAANIHKYILRRKQACAVFRVPGACPKVYCVNDAEYQRMLRKHGSYLVGVYTQECSPVWIAEDLSA